MISAAKQSVVSFAKTITIEPMILLFIIGNFILYGSQASTNMLMYKICFYERNYSEEICNNLGDAENQEILEVIQVEANKVQENAQWISSVPGLFYSFYAGALSDRLGRKPLMLIPLIGIAVSAACGILNYAFLEQLPVEFFYTEQLSAFLGGISVYYLGIYSYGTSVSPPEDRAHRMARLDGTETIATIIGTLLSPHVTTYLSYYGNYGLFCGLTLLAALYLKLFVKEPIKSPKKLKTTESTTQLENNANVTEDGENHGILYNTFVAPLTDMKDLFTKPRKKIVFFVIGLQMLIYCNYIFSYYCFTMTYYFMMAKFDGFTPEQYSYFSVTVSTTNTFFLIVFMPIVSGRFQIDDALLMTIICFLESLGYLISAFVDTLPLFYFAQLMSAIGYCKFSVSRSLLSKCCEPDEIGKVFSLNSVMMSITFMISNPVVRGLYNNTINTFVGAFYLLGAALLCTAAFGNFFTYTVRERVYNNDQKPLEDDVLNKIDLAVAQVTRL